MSLFAGLSNAWLALPRTAAWLAAVIVIGFAVVLAETTAVLVVSTRRALQHLDIALLVTAVALYAGEHIPVLLPGYTQVNDETYLGQDAVRALLHHRNPYVGGFPDLTGRPGLTPLLGGGVATHYDYPPFTAELGWALHHVSTRLGQPYVMATVALMATAVVVFFALPRPVRALSIPVVLGLGLLDVITAKGYPVVVALPLLCFAVVRWTAIGSAGRLGRRGALQAVALGIAAATHQLAWLIAVFLVLALWSVRSGELGHRRAAAVVLRFVGVAVAVFLLVNLPFIASQPRAWGSSITSVFTQHAVPFGVGLVIITVTVLGHSGALQFYSYATVALAAALMLFTLVGTRRLARAVPVFVAVLFFLSTRSTSDYIVVFVPLWLVWAITTDQDAAGVAAAFPARSTPLLRGPVARAAAVVLALVPAVGLAAVALFAPAPLSVDPVRAVVTGSRLDQLTVVVTNRTGHVVRPSFFVNQRSQITGGWTIVRGPRRIGPRQVVTVVLRPGSGSQSAAPGLTVFALSDGPPGLSSAYVRLSAAQVTTRGTARTAAARSSRRCAIELLGGAATCPADR